MVGGWKFARVSHFRRAKPGPGKGGAPVDRRLERDAPEPKAPAGQG